MIFKFNHSRLKKILYIFFIFTLCLFPFTSHAAGTPSHLSYTGLLTDTGGNPLGGGGTTYYFKFSLWDDPTPGQGNKVWPTTDPQATTLTVKQGSFSVLIGDTNNGYPDTLDYDFNSNNPVYLQVEVSSDDNTYETLAPRSTLSSTAFSQVAARVSGTEDSSFGTTSSFANTLVSMLSTAVNKAVLTIKGAAGQVANLFNILDSNDNSLFTVTADGKVGVGTSTPSSKFTLGSGQLEVPVGSVSAPSYSFTGKLSTGFYVDSSNNIQFSNSGINTFSFNNSGNLIIKSGSLILSNNGSAAAPAFNFISSTDAGMYRIGGSSNIGFSTAGIARLNIDANGNIGIGTTTPVYRMEVAGANRTTGGLAITGVSSPGLTIKASTGSDWEIFSSGSGNALGAGGLAFYDNTDNAYRMVIDTSGNVGIGTTNPNRRLHVTTGGTGTYPVLGTANGSTFFAGDNSTYGLYLGTVSADGNTWMQSMRNDSATAYNLILQPVGGNIGIGTSSPSAKLDIWGNLNVGTSSTPTLFVNTTNNRVGIGTNSPGYTLHVTDATASTIRNVSGTRILQLASYSADTNYLSSSGAQLRIATSDAQPIQFYTNNAAVGTIDSSGRFGIGTVSPTSRLHVLGDTTNSGGIASLITAGLTSSSASPVANGFGWGINANLEAADGILYGSGSFSNYWVDSGAAKTSGWSWSTRAGAAMNFTDTGLGIGTTAPTQKLVVAGTGGTNLVVDNTTSGSASIVLDANGGQGTGADYLNITQAYSGFTTINNAKADSSMSFQIGGATKMQIGASYAYLGNNQLYLDTTSGNIGMGVTNPYDRLEVSSSTPGGLGGRLVISNRAARTDGNTAELGFKVNSNFASTYYSALISALQEPGATDNSSLAFYTYNSGAARGTEKMRITSGGNIGIGNTSPLAPLHITKSSGGTGYTPAIRLQNQSSDGDSTGIDFSLSGSEVSASVRAIRGGSGTPTRLAFFTGSVPGGVGAVSERLRIDEDGNIGIGTTTPISRLTLGSGQISVASGSSLLPGYTFNEDVGLNTGLYRSNEDTIAFTAGGTKRFSISTTGMTSTVGFYNLNGSASSPAYTFDADVNTGIYNISADVLGFSTGGTERFRIYSGAVESAGQLRGAAGSAATPTFVSSGDTNTGIFFTNSDVIGFSTAGTERLRIDANGNVGIGTASPAQLLHIRGASARLRIDNTTGDPVLEMTGTAGTSYLFTRNSNWYIRTDNIAKHIKLNVGEAAGSQGYVQIGNGSSSDPTPSSQLSVRGNTNTSTFGLLDIQSYAGTSRLFVRDDGNVGIGTTTPTQKLSVIGNAQFTSVTSGTYAFDLNLTSDGTLTTSASDERLKENISSLNASSTLEKVFELRPVEFDWKSNSSHDIGLIAQEVERIFPELVFENPTDGFKGINYSRIPVLLIGAVQELGKKVEIMFAWFGENRFNVQGEVCVDDVCVTKEQFKQILQNGGGMQVQTNQSQTTENNTSDNNEVGTGEGTQSEVIPETVVSIEENTSSADEGTQDTGTVNIENVENQSSNTDSSADTGSTEGAIDSSGESSGSADSSSESVSSGDSSIGL